MIPQIPSYLLPYKDAPRVQPPVDRGYGECDMPDSASENDVQWHHEAVTL
jgi:hypothetical protein